MQGLRVGDAIIFEARPAQQQVQLHIFRAADFDTPSAAAERRLALQAKRRRSEPPVDEDSPTAAARRFIPDGDSSEGPQSSGGETLLVCLSPTIGCAPLCVARTSASSSPSEVQLVLCQLSNCAKTLPGGGLQ